MSRPMTNEDWIFLARVLDDWIDEGFVSADAPEAALAKELRDSIEFRLLPSPSTPTPGG